MSEEAIANSIESLRESIEKLKGDVLDLKMRLHSAELTIKTLRQEMVDLRKVK